MKVHQSAVAILSTTEGLNNPGKYCIPCVKGIGVVLLPAMKRWPELSQDTLRCDSYAPENGRMEVAAVLWGKGKTTKIKTLPSFLAYFVHFLRQTSSSVKLHACFTCVYIQRHHVFTFMHVCVYKHIYMKVCGCFVH